MELCEREDSIDQVPPDNRFRGVTADTQWQICYIVLPQGVYV